MRMETLLLPGLMMVCFNNLFLSLFFSFLMIFLFRIKKKFDNFSSFLSDPEDFSHYESIYTVLSEEETFRECKKMIEEVREVCSVPACTAAALLQQFKWNPENVINSWLEDPDRTLKKCGVGGQDEKKKKEKRSVGAVSDLIVKVDPGFLQCLVCYDVVKEEEVFSLGCNHPYCKDCWLNYLTLSVQDGPGCVQTHCMFPDCTELVHDEVTQYFFLCFFLCFFFVFFFCVFFLCFFLCFFFVFFFCVFFLK